MSETYPLPRIVAGIMLVVALLGAVNAGYLAWSAAIGDSPTCFLNTGCDIVAASPESRVFGIPLAFFGVFFYSVISGFMVWALAVPGAPVMRFVFPLATLGFILSLYFLYLQAFVIHAYCEYCLFSLFDATVLFLFSCGVVLRRRNTTLSHEPPGV